MKFSFVELSCRIQLDGTKLREIFLPILLVFVFSTIVVETNTRIMRSKISAISYPLVVLLMKIARHLKIANRKTEFGVVSIRI
jgi:hypothetical protein